MTLAVAVSLLVALVAATAVLLVVRRQGARTGARADRPVIRPENVVRPPERGILRPGPPGAPQPGAELGSGGQGRVYEVIGDPHRVLKRFLRPVPGGTKDFDILLAGREVVAADLPGGEISLCWPEQALVSGRDLTGYTMPRIDESFFFSSRHGVRTKHQLRDLQWAVPKKSVFAVPFSVDESDVRALVRLVARFLDAMHRHGFVYGDISWSNFSFALGPVRLCVHDFDSTRRIGASLFSRERPAETVDWDDPLAASAPVSTLDSERYKFALLVYRMLVARDRHSRVAPEVTVADLAGVQHLLRRAAGPAGTRPQLCEWLRVLPV